MRRHRPAAWIAIGLALFAVACRTPGAAPATGGEPSAAAIQRAGDEIVARYGGVYEDPAVQAYVEGVGARIIAQTPLSPAGIRFVIVDTDAVNAYAIPGATIFLTRGLLIWLNSEAQLAGVIAHEVAHLTERHVAQARGAAEDESAAGSGADDAAAARLRAYSRHQELEADRVGLGFLVAAGYPGAAMRDSQLQFDAVEEIGRLERGVSAPMLALDEAMATHPSSAERTAALANAPEFAASGEVGRERYLAAIDGIPFGPNSGDWQVHGDRIVHPAAGIEFTRPADFALAGSAGVVSGSGPGQSALVLDFVSRDPATTPAAYLNRAFSRLGSAPAETRLIGGFPAAVGSASRRDEGQHWFSVVSSIGIRETALLRVMAVAPAESAGVVRDAMGRVLQSLRRTDAGATVPGRRIAIHTVAAGETATSLADRMAVHDALPGHALALFLALNDLDPQATPEPGSTVKLVR